MVYRYIILITLLVTKLSYADGNLSADKEGTKVQGFSPLPLYSKCIEIKDNKEYPVDVLGKVAIRYVALDSSGEQLPIKRFLNGNKAYMVFSTETLVINKGVKTITFKRISNSYNPVTLCIEMQ